MADRDRTRSKTASSGPASRRGASTKVDPPARGKGRAAATTGSTPSATPEPPAPASAGARKPRRSGPARSDDGPATTRSRLPQQPSAREPAAREPSPPEPPTRGGAAPRPRAPQAPPASERPAPDPRAGEAAAGPSTAAADASAGREPSERPAATDSGPATRAPASERPVDSGLLVPGYDLDGDATFDIAPIAATEPALRRRAPLSSIPPSSAVASAGPTAASELDDSEADPAELEEQIRELEARLDRMIRQRASLVPAPSASQPGADPAAKAAQGSPDASPLARDTAASWGSARDLLSTDYYLRQWGKLGMRNRSEEVDDLGLDPVYEARIRPLVDFLYRHYFRVDVEGVEAVPEEGRCMIVANHSGGPLPYDGLMIRAAVRREHVKQRDVRWLTEDFVFHLPFVGATLNRIGAVRACPENAERLLDREHAVAVFPEGAQGLGKLFRERYKLQRFGRGGFIRLCLRTGTPIVPCAIVGAEEANPVLYRIEHMTKALGVPYFPITPTFPALGPLGLLPAPTKWKIRFAEPIDFGEHGPGTADDEVLVGRLSEKVRAAIQGMVDRTVRERRSVWFG